MPNIAMDSLTHAQKERLAFIDFSLQYFGQVSRADLIQRFKTGLAACTRDLTAYRELAPTNLKLYHHTKNYHRTDEFKPLFEHNPEAILTALCRGFGDGLSNGIQPSEYCIDAARLVDPNSDIIAALMRAIKHNKAIECRYVSLSSGESTRVIVPHTIVNNGQRWHVRAFDNKSNEFRDFVCTRLQHITMIEQPVSDDQLINNDKNWNTIVNVEIIAHPSIKHKQAIEMDYAMVYGVLNIEVRAALIGYLMRHWNVDCSHSAALTGGEYHLWLKNRNDIGEIDSLTIAPGYKELK
ncbi:WYL domain-containing protein [Psychrobium sp. nBUS_13]|uniref:WYL domain-containing protein n=1 Tax=Psychrobium sp. nBUS_13 TaxID=3395319 RepID=UPI003EBE994B